MILKHPISGHEVHAVAAEWLPGCAYFRCRQTGLQWLDPIPPGAPVFPDFSRYADGQLDAASPETIVLSMPPNEIVGREWVQKELQPAAKIVEFFAETGRFACWLRFSGYRVYLADPLDAHVAVLRKHGFPAEQTADPADIPREYCDADAVIVFESLVRLKDPGKFIRAIRDNFPKAKIFLTAPSMRRSLKVHGVDRRCGYPPDFLTRWTVPALRALLQANGYNARAKAITPQLFARWNEQTLARKLYLLLMVPLMFLSKEYEFSVSASGHRTAKAQ